MALDLHVQLFNAFLGTQEGIHSLILPDIFSPGGSVNLFIDKLGRAKKMTGYTHLNTAITTNTGGSATKIVGLFPYRSTTGGTIARRVIAVVDDGVNEWEIWKSTDDGATWTFVQDEGAGSVGFLPDARQFGDDLFITNGVITPKRWDGTSISNAGGTQSPTITSVSSGTGPLTGDYQWKLVSIKAGSQRSPGSVASTHLSLSNQGAGLGWPADADTNVIGYELYRTTGTGGLFYFVTYISGRTTVAYTDTTSDVTIFANRVLQEHGDAPPTGIYFCEPHKQRMWWLRTDANPTRAYWSDVGDADSVFGNNYINFSDSPDVGDVITGAFGNFKDSLIIFTEHAVWNVSGTGQIINDVVDWNRSSTNAGAGCASRRGVVQIPNGAKYVDPEGDIQTTQGTRLAYFTPLGDVRLFDGDVDEVISLPMKDTLSTFNYAKRSLIHAVHDVENAQVVWFYPGSGSDVPDRAVAWNYRWGVWYPFDTTPFLSSANVDTADATQLLLTGSNSTTTGGLVYSFFDGSSSFDGSNISATWMTKTLYGEDENGNPLPAYRKRWRWADFILGITNGATLTVEWLRGGSGDADAAVGAKSLSPTSETLLSSDGDTILTTDADSITVSAAYVQSKALLTVDGKYLHDEGVRLRVGDNAQNGSWSIEGFSLAYQLLTGLKRRSQ